MRVRFLANLGLNDVRECAAETKCTLDAKECVEGAVVDIPTAAAEWLGQKYSALFESAEKPIKGVAKQTELTAPAK